MPRAEFSLFSSLGLVYLFLFAVISCIKWRSVFIEKIFNPNRRVVERAATYNLSASLWSTCHLHFMCARWPTAGSVRGLCVSFVFGQLPAAGLSVCLGRLAFSLACGIGFLDSYCIDFSVGIIPRVRLLGEEDEPAQACTTVLNGGEYKKYIPVALSDQGLYSHACLSVVGYAGRRFTGA